MLSVDLEQVCFIIVKAQEFDEKVEPDDPKSGSNPSDDRDVSILEDFADDPTYQELVGAMEALNQDQLRDLVALAWVGRGTYGREEWAQARRQALDIPLEDIPRYLTGIPLLGTFLEEGLSQLGYSCEDVELGRL